MTFQTSQRKLGLKAILTIYNIMNNLIHRLPSIKIIFEVSEPETISPIMIYKI